MALLLAPDTSDHPNWGCQTMGGWFKHTLAAAGFASALTAPSAWFMQPHRELPCLDTVEDFQRLAEAVRSGRILADVAPLLQQCDAVLLNGENYIRPRTRKGRMLLFLAYLVKAVYRKPCLLTNHSVDLDEPALAGIARLVYPMFDEVHAREETTARALAGLVQPSRLKCIPDVAFAVPAAPAADWLHLGSRPGQFSAWPGSAEGFDPAAPYLTVCPSSAYSAPEHAHLDPAPAFVRLCRRLNDRVAPVVLAAPCVVDAHIMRRVQAATGYPLLGLHLPVRQAIDVLGNAAVHVGGRWHPGIFAATGGTPLVAFAANNHKVHSLLRQLDLAGPVFDPLRLEAESDAIVAQAQAHLAAGSGLRERLKARSRELGAQVVRNLDWLKQRTPGG